MRFQYFLLIFLIWSCSSRDKHEIHEQSDSGDGKVEPSICEIKYAEHFQIENGDSIYILHILDPETKEVEKSFELSPHNSYDIISLTATLTGMLSILESTEQLVGVMNRDYLYDLDLITRVETGKIEEFGDESSYSLEKIVNSGANTVLYSGFGDEFPNHRKLEKLNISIIPIYDWRETHPLGKAEWIKIAGILSGKEKEAIVFYDQVVNAYNTLAAMITPESPKPTVLAGNLWADVWYTPGGDSYMAKLIEEAGGEFVYKDLKGTGSSELTIEQILMDNKQTEIWLNPGIETKQAILQSNPHAKHLKSFENVYCYSPHMSKFWERSAAEPHLMLSDLIHIFHPEITKIDTFYFYKRIQ